jgi:3-polyprenyl-4-hydroxybenzoate decarboxylase
MSGASGAIYNIRLPEVLRDMEGVEAQPVIGSTTKLNTAYDTGRSPGGRHFRRPFRTDMMAVAPCSIKARSGIVKRRQGIC